MTAYGSRPGALYRYRRTSAVFVAPGSRLLRVIDSSGVIQGTIGVPVVPGSVSITPVFASTSDSVEFILYRGAARPNRSSGGSLASAAATVPDTAPFVRLDLRTGRTDTLAFVRAPRPRFESPGASGGNPSGRAIINPLPIVDEPVVLPGNVFAVVRGADYRVDWIGYDGKLSRSKAIPFQWKELSLAARSALVDSLSRTTERLRPSTGGLLSVSFLSADSLPDRRPPFAAGDVQVDPDGNMWIKTSNSPSIEGGSIYDVIGATGDLVGRVGLDPNLRIAGFGADRTIYVLRRDEWASRLERRRIPIFRKS